MRRITILLTLLLTVTLYCTAPVLADINTAQTAVSECIAGTDNTLLGSGYTNGDWFVLAAARSGIQLPPDYFSAYYTSLCDTLKKNGGILSERRYTDYSRTIIALTAIGKDPHDTAGYDLLEKLADFDAVKKQGVNGSIYALIALDCGNYEIPTCPEGKTQATRELYLEHILSYRCEDGGFSISGDKGDADVTAMALQAFSDYRSDPRINAAIEGGLDWLSKNRNESGGYSTMGSETCESCAQVLTALCELGIDPDTDPRFIKNGRTVADAILDYRTDGGFKHTPSQTVPDRMATEQALYSLVSYIRVKNGESSLYNMTLEKEEAAKNILDWVNRVKAALYTA